MTRWAKRIVTYPAILAGKPIVVGTRISVELILDCMASGWSMDQVVEAYLHISSEDVSAALAFGRRRHAEEAVYHGFSD
jgi:uncharacterized protein (DUF433 family)